MVDTEKLKERGRSVAESITPDELTFISTEASIAYLSQWKLNGDINGTTIEDIVRIQQDSDVGFEEMLDVFGNKEHSLEATWNIIQKYKVQNTLNALSPMDEKTVLYNITLYHLLEEKLKKNLRSKKSSPSLERHKKPDFVQPNEVTIKKQFRMEEEELTRVALTRALKDDFEKYASSLSELAAENNVDLALASKDQETNS